MHFFHLADNLMREGYHCTYDNPCIIRPSERCFVSLQELPQTSFSYLSYRLGKSILQRMNTNHESRLEDLWPEIETCLHLLAMDQGEQIATRIRPILATSLDRGRIHGFTEGKTDRVHDYVWRVAVQYELLHNFIHKLQVERSTDIWTPLFEKLQRWASRFLVKRSYNTDWATPDHIAECAVDASETILGAFFPFDVDFDPWAHVIVIHACQKFIRRNQQKSAILAESMLSLDDLLENFKHSNYQDEESHGELEGKISEAIAQLAEPRREVIRLIYFENLSASDVAQKMKKSIGAIYNLHFNALRDLQKILGINRDKINEQE